MSHGFSCFVCTRGDLLSGDAVRIIDLRPWEAPFIDRIILAGFIASAVTVWGEDLVPLVRLPPIRRLDVFKAMFSFCSQVALSGMTFLALPDSTKYAMGALKHSLHSCFVCYHQRTASLEEEVAFFNQRLGRTGRWVSCCRCASTTSVVRLCDPVPADHHAAAPAHGPRQSVFAR
jgi:hypothetical protein